MDSQEKIFNILYDDLEKWFKINDQKNISRKFSDSDDIFEKILINDIFYYLDSDNKEVIYKCITENKTAECEKLKSMIKKIFLKEYKNINYKKIVDEYIKNRKYLIINKKQPEIKRPEIKQPDINDDELYIKKLFEDEKTEKILKYSIKTVARNKKISSVYYDDPSYYLNPTRIMNFINKFNLSMTDIKNVVNKSIKPENKVQEIKQEIKQETKTKTQPTKKTNKWVEHVRAYAKSKNISYACAISEASKTYKK